MNYRSRRGVSESALCMDQQLAVAGSSRQRRAHTASLTYGLVKYRTLKAVGSSRHTQPHLPTALSHIARSKQLAAAGSSRQ